MSSRAFSLESLTKLGYSLQPDGTYAKATTNPPPIATELVVPTSKAAANTKAPKKPKGEKKSSPLSDKFETAWQRLGGPMIEPEHRFDKTRKWRFDFAHPRTMIAIEIDGGIFNGGRHNRASGFIKDCEKFNAATRDGWRVFRLATGMVKDEAVQQIIDAIRKSES